jgi:putative transposase
MPTGLKRFQEDGDCHFITFSCHGRKPYLTEPGAYQTFQKIFEQTRQRHGFRVYGYVLMPEHVHLLLSEPPKTPLASVLKALKQETAKKLKAGRDHFWQPRYYDFNVFTEGKYLDKLRYIHRNPVTRGLVARPEDWSWSSFCHYATGLPGTVEIESWWTQQARVRIRGMTLDAPAPEGL